MRLGPFDRFQEISINFKWAEANVALHSKAVLYQGFEAEVKAGTPSAEVPDPLLRAKHISKGKSGCKN
jgi:hypothetical protein